MKLQGYVVVIICSLLIQLSKSGQARYIYFEDQYSISSRAIITCAMGSIFLAYPFLGHLADVYLTRYRALKWSVLVIIAGQMSLLLCMVVEFIISIDNAQRGMIVSVSDIGMAICSIMCIVGIGLFEANAVQFGLDQLLEAPTQELVAFIHWYYWSQNTGSLILFYFDIGILATGNCVAGYKMQHIQAGQVMIAVLAVIAALAAGITLILICVCKKNFYIHRAGLNPFKNIYRVLKYTWKHKVPENRSAFTYWEEDIPPRIDVGKDKYGGPFTTEEVEDTKIFLCILPLLLTLFGFHLAGDGLSAPEQFQRASCPSLPVLLLLVYNPFHLSALVIVVGIPLYRLVLRKVLPCFRRVLMLTRKWIGLFLSLLQVILYIIVAVNHDITYWQQHHTSVNGHPASVSSTTYICYIIRTGDSRNGSCETFDDPIDNTYLWFIIPQFLNGISSLFVSMTALEFISAQAPRTTQGLLIGLWYAMFSIKYLIVGILDTYISERRSWLICEGVKGFLILVSLVLLSCKSRHYHYRQRDEIVNEQWMIEEIFERRLDQEEEYMQERRAILANMSAYNK